MDGVDCLEPSVGVVRACATLGVNRARVYRVRARRCHLAGVNVRRGPRPRPPLALTGVEQDALLQVLNSERFADMAPASIHATLLDEGRYLGSVRTMYRLLALNDAVRERRNQLTHPVYAKPELLATGACEVWSWDITKLKGPAKWTCFRVSRTRVRARDAVLKMGVGLPKSACRSRLQTARCCCAFTAWW